MPHDFDFCLTLQSRLDGGGRPGVGRGPTTGKVRVDSQAGAVWGWSFVHEGVRIFDEAEYLTLTASLDLLARWVEARGGSSSATRLLVLTSRELVVRQIAGLYRVRSKALVQVHRGALARLRPWREVRVEHLRASDLLRRMRGVRWYDVRAGGRCKSDAPGPEGPPLDPAGLPQDGAGGTAS